jgi:pyruvate dehydrogenase E2 component (dihydrolipoyllysine-residue acetyltransferase)
MAVEVVMPQMGESIFEGTITKWLKKPGDRVERDEPLLEISTDKVDAEIQSPAAGVLTEIKVGAGQTVPIRTVLALIDAQGAATVPLAPSPGAPAAAPPSQPAPDKGATGIAPGKGATGITPGKDAREIADDVGPISPLVRRLAGEHGVDLSTVRGTGAGGRITKQDVLAAAERKGTGASAASAAALVSGAPSPGGSGTPSPGGSRAPLPGGPGAHVTPHAALESAVPRERIYFGRYEIQPMSVMRQRIAEHMVLSKRVSPHVYSFDEADMTRILALRDAAKDEFEKRNHAKLTFMPFFVRACAEALRAFPIVNASVDGTSIVLHREINIGIAVALDAGLIVPVLKGADEKDFLGLQRAVTDLADRARAKKLHPDEVHESTFSITNPGVFGGLMGLPVINQPNVAILAIGAIQKRPVVVGDAVVPRSMVYLTLSYDHRVVDGAVAHQFLARIKQRLESWDEKL